MTIWDRGFESACVKLKTRILERVYKKTKQLASYAIVPAFFFVLIASEKNVGAAGYKATKHQCICHPLNHRLPEVLASY